VVEMELVIKKWGRSFGAVIPMDKVKQMNLKENDVVNVTLFPKKNPLKETFGTFKFKRSVEEILRESDRECWDE
jgi:antitoxin component of MazEF toxin-antitoxin module